MSLRITILCDACPATIADVSPGDLTRALKRAGWSSRDADGRTQDLCPRCAAEQETD